MTAIGVFGGTFAPIHHGHLRLALELRDRLRLDTVHVVPSGLPPHRESPGIAAQRRLEWVQLAIAGEPGLVADDREVRREGRSYTVDTLADLRSAFPSASIALLLGDDAANQFHRWRRWRDIAELAHLVFVERPGLLPEPAPELVALLRGRRANSVDELHAKPAGLWMPASVPPLAISSTRVRGLLRAGRSVRGLVPQAVIDSFTTEDLRLLTHHEEPALD